jgi:pyridoxine 5-phosphate synthase
VPARLGVNIDHVATLRQARGTHEPEPVMAALLAQSAGAHGITIHLRSDRRHIQERDARLLKEVLTIPLTIKSAATADGLEAAVPVNPAWVALVPETREEPTTQGGLDVLFLHAHLRQTIRELHASQIRVSLFVDPQPDQLKMAAKLEADGVEFNTGIYADLAPGTDPAAELGRLREAARLGSRLGMKVLAGHGLTLLNVGPIAAIPEIEELTIGHSIVARAVMVGMERAVREMLAATREGLA